MDYLREQGDGEVDNEDAYALAVTLGKATGRRTQFGNGVTY
jgi:hypothetical protein